MRFGKQTTRAVASDGTAPCDKCREAVPIDISGHCELGHRVTTPEAAAAALAGLTGPPPAAEAQEPAQFGAEAPASAAEPPAPAAPPPPAREPVGSPEAAAGHEGQAEEGGALDGAAPAEVAAVEPSQAIESTGEAEAAESAAAAHESAASPGSADPDDGDFDFDALLNGQPRQ